MRMFKSHSTTITTIIIITPSIIADPTRDIITRISHRWWFFPDPTLVTTVIIIIITIIITAFIAATIEVGGGQVRPAFFG